MSERKRRGEDRRSPSSLSPSTEFFSYFIHFYISICYWLIFNTILFLIFCSSFYFVLSLCSLLFLLFLLFFFYWVLCHCHCHGDGYTYTVSIHLIDRTRVDFLPFHLLLLFSHSHALFYFLILGVPYFTTNQQYDQDYFKLTYKFKDCQL